MVFMLNKIVNRLKLIFSTKGIRRSIWPKTKKLTARHIKNCKLVEDRYKLLQEIPAHSVCAEVGILKGDFSIEILQTVRPEKLHLIDVDPQSVKIAKVRFKESIHERVVAVHEQDSSSFLLSMPDETFDWIYIDGDHSYEGVKKDLEAAHQKIKPDGLITLNDYIFFGSSDLTKYGVIEATNEFCLEYDYELIHLALHGRMYNDVTIRRIR